MKLEFKKIKPWILPVAAGITFGCTRLAALNTEAVENYYSSSIYPVFAQILSSVSGIFPFSLDDVFYFGLICTLLVVLVLLLLRRITFKKAAFIVLNTLSVVFICFYLFWGFNYFRPNVNQRLGLKEDKAKEEKLLNELKNQVSAINRSYCSFDNFDKKDIDAQIEESYKNLAPALKIKFPAGRRKAKKITFSRFFAQAGISGYYGPFFNEVHVNSKILPQEYPFVLAHEKAHQFGITSEAEANFYAWLVCVQSQSRQLQYSANIHILRFFMVQSYQLEGYKEIIAELDERVKTDIIRIRENWQKLSNEKVDRVATKVNDAYLKTNKVEKGVEDYFGVVKFVMDFQSDTIFQKQHQLR